MRYILWSEGTGDDGLIQVIDWLLRQNYVSDPAGELRTQQNYKLADVVKEENWHLLFLHRDADSDREISGKGPDTRRKQMDDLILKTKKDMGEGLPPTVIIVPVQMTEAWLMVCAVSLRTWAGSRGERATLTLPPKVEQQNQAKEHLKQIMEGLLGEALNWGTFSVEKRRLWREIHRTHQGFSVLDSIPSYRRLRDDVAQVVKQNGLASL